MKRLTARAVTDERGKRVHQNEYNLWHKYDDIYSPPYDPWKYIFCNYQKATLKDLLGNPDYSYISHYLAKRYPFKTPIYFDKQGIIRSVIIRNREYRANAYFILDKNLDDSDELDI